MKGLFHKRLQVVHVDAWKNVFSDRNHRVVAVREGTVASGAPVNSSNHADRSIITLSLYSFKVAHDDGQLHGRLGTFDYLM